MTIPENTLKMNGLEPDGLSESQNDIDSSVEIDSIGTLSVDLDETRQKEVEALFEAEMIPHIKSLYHFAFR